MNEKARILGCENTRFITPNGLDAQEQGANGQTKIHSTTAGIWPESWPTACWNLLKRKSF